MHFLVRFEKQQVYCMQEDVQAVEGLEATLRLRLGEEGGNWGI